MAGPVKSIAIEINSDEDLKNWSKTVGEDLRKIADDLEILEAILFGKLRKMKMVDGSNPIGPARNVTRHVKTARLMIWAARKSCLGVYKSFLKQFGAEIEAVKRPKTKAKSDGALNITP